IGTTRDQLLLEMEAARDRVDEAIAGLSEEQIARPDLDGWSVKDHLTHLTLWHELRFFEISRIARGGRAGFPVTDEAGVEHINEQFAANRRPLPFESRKISALRLGHSAGPRNKRMIDKIHHIGIAVHSLDDALTFYRDTLGLDVHAQDTVEDQGVKAALLTIGQSEIELLEPTRPDSAVGRFLERKGEGLHHICFQTPDVDSELEALKRKGIELVDQT